MAKTNKLQRANRRKRVAELYLVGHSFRQISDKLEDEDFRATSPATVSRDINYLEEQWQDSALIDLDKAKGRELARLNRIERMCLEMLEDSRQDIEEKKQKVKTVAGKKEEFSVADDGELRRDVKPTDPEPLEMTRETKTKRQDGDPRLIKRIQKCVELRIKLLGLDEPTSEEDDDRLDAFVSVVDEMRETAKFEEFEDEPMT